MSTKVHTISTTFATLNIAVMANTLTFYSDLTTAEDQADKRDHFLLASPEDLDGLSGAQIVDLYNVISSALGPDYSPVKRFSDKSAATTRTWIRLQDLANKSQKFKAATKPHAALKAAVDKAIASGAPVYSGQPAKATDYPAVANPAKIKAATLRRSKGVNLQPLSRVVACRAGSKQAALVDILSRPQGATFDELKQAMSLEAFPNLKPWTDVTTKSSLNWDVHSVKGYGICTSKRGDVDCYHLVLPAGMSAPLPHTPRKAKA